MSQTSFCIQCGIAFEPRPWYKNYCSNKCKNVRIDFNVVNNNKDKISRQKQTCFDKAKESFDNNKKMDIRSIKRVLLKLVNNACEVCGVSEWMGKKISLEVHHKDGNNKNNKNDNLQILCLNCHSQTHNYRSKNKKK